MFKVTITRKSGVTDFFENVAFFSDDGHGGVVFYVDAKIMRYPWYCVSAFTVEKV